MSLDPNEPGAMPLAAIGMTKPQVRHLAKAVEEYLATGKPLDSVRVEKMADAHLRLVFIGPDGDPADEMMLLPH